MTDNEKMRRAKLMAKNMAAMIVWLPETETFERASGLCVCEACGLEYFDHPSENGLTLTCDGRFWKL